MILLNILMIMMFAIAIACLIDAIRNDSTMSLFATFNCGALGVVLLIIITQDIQLGGFLGEFISKI